MCTKDKVHKVMKPDLKKIILNKENVNTSQIFVTSQALCNMSGFLGERNN